MGSRPKQIYLDVNILDNRYYENVINEMQPFFDEHGFTLREEGNFLSDSRSVKIEYSEERQMYLQFTVQKRNNE